MQKITLFCLATFLLLPTSVTAADNVVVVPLMRSGDPWIRVYGDNNRFVGFTHSLPSIVSPYSTLISSNNYSTISFPGSPDRILFFPINSKVYFTPDCSGSSYINPFSFLFTVGLGMVFDIAVSSTDHTTWYIQYGTSPVTVLPGNTYYTKKWDTSCTPATNGATEVNYLETHPNDYNITGFRDSSYYKWPLNYQYSLPKSP